MENLPNELDLLISEETETKGETPTIEEINTFLENNTETIDIFSEEETESEEGSESESESESEIEYGLGKSFAVVHETLLPPSAKFLIETFTANKTVNEKLMKLNASQKKELASAYEVIAKTMTSGDSPLFNATLSILAIASGQILAGLQDKEVKKEIKTEKPVHQAAKKTETRGRKKGSTKKKVNEN